MDTITNAGAGLMGFRLPLRALGMTGAVLLAALLGPAPASAETFDKIHNFAGNAQGEQPQGKLAAGPDGALYGTTFYGGQDNRGTVFRLQPNRGGTEWEHRVIYSFAGGSDGANPVGALAVDKDGIVYGVTNAGGGEGCGSGCGVAFMLRRSPGEGWDKDTLHIFRAGRDGSLPQGGLILRNGVLYGTTSSAGPFENGTVFKLFRGNNRWKFQLLYAFRGEEDGRQPEGPPIFFDGDLYGTTAKGGRLSGECSQNSDGCGTIYRLRKPSGSAAMGWLKKTIHRFEGGPDDGKEPGGILALRNGSLYGVTRDGGEDSCGTVFRVNPKDDGSEAVIHHFTCNRGGSRPVEVGFRGERLIGVTQLGGSGVDGPNAGTVFALKQQGAGWDRTTLHAFSGGADGGFPQAGLLITRSGEAYGTTYEGGTGFGTVFELFGPD